MTPNPVRTPCNAVAVPASKALSAPDICESTDEEFLTPGPLTFDVPCRTGSGRWKNHAITIAPDWTVTTPHDLELERIACALGSGSSCVHLVEKVVPSVHVAWSVLSRQSRPGIICDRSGRWHVADPVETCACRVNTWAAADRAYAHVSSTAHLARRFGLQERELVALKKRIEGAAGRRFEGQPQPWPESAAVSHHTDFAWLWSVGVPSKTVMDLHRRIGLDGPLTAIGYLHVVTRGIDPVWLRPFAADGGEAVYWAASGFGRHDQEHPDERLSWFHAGVHWQLINRLLGSAYGLEDVRRLSQATGRRLSAEAATLAAWLSAGCTPTIDDVIEVWRAHPGESKVPPRAAIDRVYTEIQPYRSGLTVTEVGLLLAHVGTPTETAALIKRGVRSPREYHREMNR